MIGLDTADLMVIAGGVMDCDSGTALAQADITAANDALAQAGPLSPLTASRSRSQPDCSSCPSTAGRLTSMCPGPRSSSSNALLQTSSPRCRSHPG